MAVRGFKTVALILAFAFSAAAVAATDSKPAAVEFPVRSLPERIVLTPGADPAHQMAVSWRSDSEDAGAELAVALSSPGFPERATPVSGTTITLPPEAGGGLYHHAAFSGLKPDAAYAYRVKASGGWSEWFSFRTASEGFKPFRFLYFGDHQHGILSLDARVVRAAFLAAAAPALALHGGDLVNSHDLQTLDNEWGQWAAAGGFAYASVPQVPAIGNHEYDGDQPGPFWQAMFALPDNGPDPVKGKAYHLDYQGVRFIMLDGTAALSHGALEPQTAWMEGLLKNNPARWTVVMVHQPVFMCSRQAELPAFQSVWKPLFAKYKVDLVLQGHDHCYARWSNPGSTVKATRQLTDPVYVISVSGAKMYGINDRTLANADRLADDTQMYQVIDVAKDRLTVNAFTATGTLYDSFAIVRGAKGQKHLVNETNLPPRRLCNGDTGPDGLPCIAKRK